MSDIGERFYPISDMCNLELRPLQSDIGSFDFKLSPVSFITDNISPPTLFKPFAFDRVFLEAILNR
jgi:hypothetical protein